MVMAITSLFLVVPVLVVACIGDEQKRADGPRRVVVSETPRG